MSNTSVDITLASVNTPSLKIQNAWCHRKSIMPFYWEKGRPKTTIYKCHCIFNKFHNGKRRHLGCLWLNIGPRRVYLHHFLFCVFRGVTNIFVAGAAWFRKEPVKFPITPQWSQTEVLKTTKSVIRDARRKQLYLMSKILTKNLAKEYI